MQAAAALPAAGAGSSTGGVGEPGTGRDIMITHFEASDGFRVNSFVPNEQDRPRTVALEDGRFLVIWRGGFGGSIDGQIYERDGTPAGAQFRITDWYVHPYSEFAVTALPGGGFAVAWGGDSRSEGGNTDVNLQIFDSAGQRGGAAILVNQETANIQYNPAIAILANGNFIVTWDQLGGPGFQVTTVEVKAQIFAPSGARIGPEFVVNTTTLDSQHASTVTPLAEGGFVVAWHDTSRTNSHGDTNFTAAQVFTDSGARVGAEFRVNTATTNDQRSATIAALSDGGFVIAWTDTSSGSAFEGGFPARFQLFTRTGAKVGGEVTIDTSGTDTTDTVRVDKLTGGGFIISWADEVWSGGYILSSQLFGQVYDEAGQAVGGRLTLSAATPYHWSDSLVSLADGSFILAYQRREFEGEPDVYARLFTAIRSGETLHGTAAAETLGGGGLDDFLGGYGGNDALAGGAGEDMLDGGSGDDQLDGGADADRLTSGTGNDQLDGGTGADLMDGGAGDDRLDGGADSDRLVGGAGNDRLDGGTGADRMSGGFGDDVYFVDDSGDVVAEVPGQGTDALRTALASYDIPVGVEWLIGTSSGGQALTGSGGNDSITGGDGNDVLAGLGGDDVLDGGAGADWMTGGAGNDSYVIDAQDSLSEAAGGGTDEIRTAAASYTLATANIENLRGLSDSGQALAGDEHGNRIEGAGGADLLDGAGGADMLVGGGGADTLSGAGGNDVLDGGAGGDSLDGGEANDSLDGGAGSDALTGGEGDDVLKFAAVAGSGDVDIVDGGNGVDLLVVSFAAGTDPAGVRYSIVDAGGGSYSGWYARGSERVEFSGIEAFQISGGAFADELLGGSLADYLIGGAGDDLIEGRDGNDLLVGGEGSDRLVGGAGDDHYVVSDGSDTIVEQEDGGIDQVQAGTAAYTLGANLENLVGTAGGPQTLTGNGLANRIVALGGASLLQGAGGADILESGSWSDTLDGGPGADTMRGGDGDDIYFVDDAGDVVADIGGWSDEIRTDLAEFTLTLASGVEYLTGLSTTGQILTGTTVRNWLRGGSGDDRLLGMGGNDILNGGAGNDYLDDGIYSGYMFGGTGDDTYVVDYSGEYIAEHAGEGLDRVLTNLPTYTLANHVELLTGTVDTGQNLRGNATDNVITGGGGNDIVLLHDVGADSAFGNGGDDVIFFGGALTAADRVDGGSGTDTLALQGVYSGLTLTATVMTGVEVVRLMTRSDPIYGVLLQNPTAYALIADDAALAAGATLKIDGGSLAANEALAFNGGSELDGSFVVTGGAGADSLTGGAGLDSLNGGAGADQLSGGDGEDTLTGGGGNDRLDGGNGNDTADYSQENGPGAVLVNLQTAPVSAPGGLVLDALQARDSHGHTDSFSSIENVKTGGGNDSVYGDELANRIQTGGGNDFLMGGPGADILIGNSGDDIYSIRSVDSAAFEDMIIESDNEGTDEVRTDLAAFSLAGIANVENLTATDAGAHDFRGNALNNMIRGGSANDMIRLQDGGDDSTLGGGGTDQFYYGSAFTAADSNDGGADTDVVVLQGNYVVAMGASSLVNVEYLSLQSGSSTRYGEAGTSSYDYDITFLDANVAAGQRFVVNASQLLASESFVFDGSAETDGQFLVYAGFGDDDLAGGSGNDMFHFEGTRWSSGDSVDGGAGADALIIRGTEGTIDITFGELQIRNMESITVSDRFGLGAAGRPSYGITLSNGNVTPGGALILNGSTLFDPGQAFNVDGSAVTGGLLKLYGGAGGDRMIGGAGNDLFYAAGGRDVLTGGGGADTFQLRSLSDSAPDNRDSILDFASGVDKLDLSFLDADSGVEGNQSFRFIGADAFSNKAGELRAYDTGSGWRVEADVNGDGEADFAIDVMPATPDALVGADFIL
jgi:Ca2+-binding RTX toxin-like protein